MDTSKIIKGAVSNGRYTVTAPIVKEDYGLYLQIEGVELPSTYEVDFSNSENSGTSVTMIGNAGGVRIPRQFIDTGKDIFAFLYWVGEDYGKTVYKFRIPNKVRPDRTNEEPTPEEQSVIDQAINALNEAVAQTAQDVIDADASAQSASADAERAEEARTDAQNYATQAEQARDDAQTYANNASASATASASSASASANSASQAQGYAQSASASAQSASGYASNAQTSANTASNKASEASTSAQTASNKASESAQSASQALSYKTDAESAKTASQTAQGLAESARDSAVQAKTDAESARDDAESARDEAQRAVESISGALDDKADVITDTASGAIASFSDGADDLPLKSLVIDINPIQDLSHGDPSPENICPISGWTQVDVNHSDADMTNPTTITIDLGQTVYGGKLDVLSGVLVIDRAMRVFDGSEAWSYTASVSANTDRGLYLGSYITGKGNLPITSNYLRSVADQSVPWSGYINNNGVLLVMFPKGTFANATEWKAYLAENPLSVIYPLTTPIEIQLSANQLNSLYGVNNIWADSGDTEVVYRADTKAYIAKKIAEAISALS